ncbi:MAG: polysaccharide deacetylase family protein [Gemmataceae bacterium]
MTKPLASMSLDLDNKWSYMKTHGDAGWEQWPSYLSIVVPRVVEFLKPRNLKITWFIVGQDAAQPSHRDVLRQITDAGHEVGNHSYQHEPWLHLYPEEDIEAEIARTEDAIEAATGQRPVGFRGPGYSLSETVLRVLKRRGYRFDCSTFPTYLGPLARAYYFMTAKLPAEEKAKRAKLFGTIGDGLRPLKPYRWNLGEESLLEIPVTTLPIFKTPIHLSYLLYLGTFSRLAAKLYFRMALLLCRATRTPPSILLHPLDFLGCDDDKDLSFFPAMNRPSEWKLKLAGELFSMLTNSFEVVCMSEHARRLDETKMRLRKPDFPATTDAPSRPAVVGQA